MAILDVNMLSVDQAVRSFSIRDKLKHLNSPDAISRSLNDVGSHQKLTFQLMREFRLGLHLSYVAPKAQEIIEVHADEQRDPHWKSNDG